MSRTEKRIECYQIKDCKLSGTSYSEVYKKSWQIYLTERKKSKRRAYIRSAYFKKDKIFLDIFWNHLKQKRKADRKRRLRFYNCALMLLSKSRNNPEIFESDNIQGKLYRFAGITNGEVFIVQVKESANRNKYLVSVFPSK